MNIKTLVKKCKAMVDDANERKASHRYWCRKDPKHNKALNLIYTGKEIKVALAAMNYVLKHQGSKRATTV